MTLMPPSTAVASLECQVPVLLSSLSSLSLSQLNHGWAPLHTHNAPSVKKVYDSQPFFHS